MVSMEGNPSGITSLKYVVNKSFFMVAFESYVCLNCDDLLTASPHKIGIQSCECGELKIEQTKNIHRVFGTFGKYYCSNPQKREIIGNRIKIIQNRQKIDDCVAEVYSWETIDRFEDMKNNSNRQVDNRKLNKGNEVME